MQTPFIKEDFVLLQNTRDFTNPYILQSNKPFCVGLPIRVRPSDLKTLSELQKAISDGDPVAKVPGYSIYVVSVGTFIGEEGTREEKLDAMQRMAEYCVTRYVQHNPTLNSYYQE